MFPSSNQSPTDSSLPSDAEIEAIAALESLPPQDDPDEPDARRKGWLPKEEFEGDPSKWVDAKTFIERGDKFTRNLQRKVADLERKLSDFEGTRAQYKKFMEEQVAKKDAELKTAINALRVQRSQAQSEGDHDTAIELEDRIEALQTSRKEVSDLQAQKPETPAQNPSDAEAQRQRGLHPAILDEWVEDGNDWFKTDAKLRDYAIQVAEELHRQNVPERGRKFLDLIADRMSEEFPRKFASKRTAPSSGVESSSRSASSRTPTPSAAKGRTARDLPAADLAIMRDLVRGGYTTEKDFLNSYFGR